MERRRCWGLAGTVERLVETKPIITFRNMKPSPEVEASIHQHVEDLEKVHSRIIGCEVVLAASQKRKVTGQDFEVTVSVKIPGPDIRVARQIGRSEALQDIKIAIHQAFDAARRELKEATRKMGRVEVKAHPPILHGTIDRLFEGEGYGFISADNNRDIYFDRDSLTTGSWDDLRVDMKVRFREEVGDKGPYAANVAAVGSVKH